MVPVYLALVPVGITLVAEEDGHGVAVVLVGDDEQLVVHLQHGLRKGYYHFLSTPDARDDEVLVGTLGEVLNLLAVKGGVHHFIFADIGMVGLVARAHLEVGGAHQEAAQHHHHQDDAHHTEGIGDGGTQGERPGGFAHLMQRLLGGTQRRGVGCGSAEQTHHVGQIDSGERHQHDGEERTQEYHAQRPQIEGQSFTTERTEEVGAHAETQHIDKDDQSEGLGVSQTLGIDGHADMSGKNTNKKHESHAQRHAHQAHLAQGEAQGAYQ